MDIKSKRLVKGAIGSAATEYNATHWFVRAGSFQYGAETTAEAVDAEKRENDLKFGVPYADNLPAPSDPAGPPNCGARYQTASYDADAPLPNPHNWSSNPGFMSVSTGDMATSGSPRTGTIGRTATASAGNVSLPAPGSVDPGQDGGPQVVSSGFSG